MLFFYDSDLYCMYGIMLFCMVVTGSGRYCYFIVITLYRYVVMAIVNEIVIKSPEIV